jgi:hypothetical protein
MSRAKQRATPRTARPKARKMMTNTALFRFGVLAASLVSAAAARAAQPPAGRFYQLTVTTSFEPSFTDCWSFAENGRVITSHSGGLGSFPYQLAGLNNTANQFQAVWCGSISIGFSGVTGSTITGNAVDSRTRTYNFTGSQVSGCVAATRNIHGFQTR